MFRMVNDGAAQKTARSVPRQAERRPFGRLAGFPVLIYHGLADSMTKSIPAGERKYWALAEHFRAHLHRMRVNGCRVGSLADLWSGEQGLSDGERAAALTFDDGRETDYRIAYPALLEVGAAATFFVNTAAIGESGFLNWRQIDEMQRSGMSFHSHGHTHVDLTRLPDRELERQLSISKQVLEDHTGRQVQFLAVPYGFMSRRVVELSRQVGYRAVCSSWNWPAQPGSTTINRVGVFAHTTLDQLNRILTGDGWCYATRMTRDAMVWMPKRLLRYLRSSRLHARQIEATKP